MTKKKMEDIAKSMDIAKGGVDYSPKSGATCPHCKTPRAPVVGSPRWYDDVKIRYHKCRNPKCPIAICRTTIKSVQFDK